MSLDFDTILLAFMVIVIVIAAIGAVAILIGALYGVPYVPTPQPTVNRMVELAHITPHSRVIDIGCGDGRLPITALQAGAQSATGIEVSMPVYFLAVYKRWRADYSAKQYRLILGNLWSRKQLIAEHDVVFCFLLDHLMERFFHEVWPELQSGTVVISHAMKPRATELPIPQTHAVPGMKGRVHIWHKS